MANDRQKLSTLMNTALEEARLTLTNESGDIPVGCLIIKDDQVIAKAHNEKELTNDPTAHAEILAIRRAAVALKSWRLRGCLLITTLEPCPMCTEAIIQSRVSTLVFGAYDIRSGACGSAFNLFGNDRIYPIPEIIGGIEEDQCQQLLNGFFKTVRERD